MRFFLDEDLSQIIARVGREQFRLDIISAHECGREEQPDEQQLLFAAQDGRCLVTNNDGDFRLWTARFLIDQLPHAGVLALAKGLAPNRFSDVALALNAYHQRYPNGVPPYFFDYLHPVNESAP